MRPIFKIVLTLFVIIFPPMANPLDASEFSNPSRLPVQMDISKTDWPIILMAQMDIPVNVLKVWRILTDYDHLADFIPQVRSSHVVQRNQKEIILDQISEVHFLIFKKAISIQMSVLEKPYVEISFERIGGNMTVFAGKWTLEPMKTSNSTHLTYSLQVKPAFYAPRWVVQHSLDHDIPDQLKAIAERAMEL